MITIGVRGNRNYPITKDFEKTVEQILVFAKKMGALAGGVNIVTGGSRGPERAFEGVAYNVGLPVTIMRPDWMAYQGVSAAAARTREMNGEIEMLVAFWDGKSKGTEMAINEAQSSGKLVILVGLDGHIQFC